MISAERKMTPWKNLLVCDMPQQCIAHTSLSFVTFEMFILIKENITDRLHVKKDIHKYFLGDINESIWD